MEHENGERRGTVKKVAILLIVIGVIGMGLTAKQIFSREKVQQEQYFSKDHFDYIVVEGGKGNVKILPTSSDDIEVSWKGSIFNRDSEDVVSIEEKNSELKVHVGNGSFFNIPFLNFNFLNRLEVRIFLPEKQYNSLSVKNDVGNTVIQDIWVDHLTAENDVANITIENVDAKSMVLENNVGNMTLKNNQSKLHAESDVGNIVIDTDEIKNDMTLLSDVGKIRMTVPTIPHNVTFDANSSVGNVKVFGEKGSYINKDADYIVSMSTDVGNITVDYKK